MERVLGAQAYIKKLGFDFDKISRGQRRLLKSLSAENKARLQYIWSMQEVGESDGLEQYLIPQNLEQAALLFSQDWPRIVSSLTWFDKIVSQLNVTSVVEMGCGPGFLLSFLLQRHPGISVQGIDIASNLVRIASELCGRALITGDYLAVEPEERHGLVICCFGFDLARFIPSNKPHSSATCGEISYCRHCSENMEIQLVEYMKSWRRWGTEDSPLAITGRITDFGMLRAFVLAARKVGWVLSIPDSTVLKVRPVEGEMERFPALLFFSETSDREVPSLEETAQLYLTQAPEQGI